MPSQHISQYSYVGHPAALSQLETVAVTEYCRHCFLYHLNVLTGPQRDCDPAELSPRRRVGATGAPIDATAAHCPVFPYCNDRPHHVVIAAANPSTSACMPRDIARGYPSIYSLTGGPGEVDVGDDERRAKIAQAIHKPHVGAERENPRGYHSRQLERSRTVRLFLWVMGEVPVPSSSVVVASHVRSFVWGAGEPLRKTKAIMMTQLRLMRS